MVEKMAPAWPKEFAQFEPRAEELYSDEYVAEMCRRFEIPKSLEWDFFNLLARTTNHYLNWLQIRSSKVQKKAVRDDLRSITKHANAAALRLSHLLEVFQSELKHEYEALMFEALDQQDAQLRQIGAARDATDVHGGVDVLTLQEAVAGFRMTSIVCENALLAMEPEKRGPKENHPVRFWLQDCCNFWETKLGRKATLDMHQGEMTTTTGAFLSALIRPLDPTAERSIPHAFAQLKKRRAQAE